MTTTKARKAAKSNDAPAEHSAEAVPEDRPVQLDQFNRRTDADVMPFAFCRLESGDHRGEIGSFESVVSEDSDGYPEVVLVKLRNSNTLVTIDYADLTPVPFGGR